mgnify:CR=1 FL=1
MNYIMLHWLDFTRSRVWFATGTARTCSREWFVTGTARGSASGAITCSRVVSMRLALLGVLRVCLWRDRRTPSTPHSSTCFGVLPQALLLFLFEILLAGLWTSLTTSSCMDLAFPGGRKRLERLSESSARTSSGL